MTWQISQPLTWLKMILMDMEGQDTRLVECVVKKILYGEKQKKAGGYLIRNKNINARKSDGHFRRVVCRACRSCSHWCLFLADEKDAEEKIMMIKRVIIELTAHEIVIANTAGNLRQEQAEKRGIKEQKRARMDGRMMHIIGAWGEVGVGKYLGRKLDVFDLVKSDPNDIVRKPDILFKKWKIDVKSTSMENPVSMRVHVPKKPKDSNAYASARILFDEKAIQLHGWAMKEEVWQHRFYNSNDNRYEYPLEFLMSPYSLKFWRKGGN